MVSIWKNKQQNKRFFIQLEISDADFLIGQNKHEAQAGSKTNVLCIRSPSSNMKCPIQLNNLQADIHTIEENVIGKVRSEVDNVMTTDETRVQDAVLTAIETLLIPRVEMAKKSAHAAPGRSFDGDVLDLDQRDFPDNIAGLQLIASSGISSRMDLNRIDETRGNNFVEGGDLLVNEEH